MKIGLIGINNLKQEEHFKRIRQALDKNLHGMFSHSDDLLPISSNYKIKLHHSANDLYQHVDAVYFANSLRPNYDFALSALKKSCHLYIEDISELSFDEAKLLYKVAFEARANIQLKHSVNFSPEFLEIKSDVMQVKLIEIQKGFSKLMRFDDYFSEILTNLYFAYLNIQSSVKKFSTFTLPLDNHHFSLVHIRLEYDNGGIVNLKINNIANKEESVASFYGTNKVINVNFMGHYADKLEFINGQINRVEYTISGENAFQNEIHDFIKTCTNQHLQNLSESPTELKLIKLSHEIKDKLIQSSQPY